jgi:hypothetical protein
MDFFLDKMKPKLEASRAKYSWVQDAKDHGIIRPAIMVERNNYLQCSEYEGLRDFLVANGFQLVGTGVVDLIMPRFRPGSDRVPEDVTSEVL